MGEQTNGRRCIKNPMTEDQYKKFCKNVFGINDKTTLGMCWEGYKMRCVTGIIR